MKKLLFLLCIIFFSLGCSSDKNEVLTTLELSETEVLFSANEETKSFEIRSNESWTISQIPDWLTIEKKSGTGTLKISAKAATNPKEEERSATLKITAKEKSKELKVRQNAKNVTLSISKTELTFPAEPTTEAQTFDIVSNEAWTATDIPEWCTLSADKGDGNMSISVTSSVKNYIDTQRDATILIKAGSKTVELKVIQEPLDVELSFSNMDLSVWNLSPTIVASFYNEASSKSVMIRSNTKWSVKSNATWVVVNKENGENNEPIAINIEENKSKTDRNSDIILTAGSKSIKIIVKQGAEIDVPNNTPYQINERDNAPRIGDRLIKKQVNFVDPGASGENVTWNFSKLTSINDNYEVIYEEPPVLGDYYILNIVGEERIKISDIPANSLYVCTEHNTMYYFQIKENLIHALGHENPVTELAYNPEMISGMYPTYYNSSYKYNYRSNMLYSGTIHSETKGYTEMKADGYGTIILPSGTYTNALRVKHVQIIEDISNDYTNPDIDPENLKYEYTIDKWYVKGYRYPVLEMHRYIRIKTGEEIFTSGFYYSPKDQITDQEKTKRAQTTNYMISKPAVKKTRSLRKATRLESIFPILRLKR